MFSLAELTKLEAARLAEEQESRARATREQEAARRLAEERAREEEAARAQARAEAESRAALEREIALARIEAAKQGELEARRMATEFGLRAEAEERRREHERELSRLCAEARTKARGRRALVAAVVTAAVAAMGVSGWFGIVQPKREAAAAIAAARAHADSDDPAVLATAQGELDLAAMRDPANPELAPLREAVQRRRDALEKKRSSQIDELEKATADARKRTQELAARLAARPTATEAAPITTPRTRTAPPTQATARSSGWGARCPPGVRGVPGCE